MELRIRWCSSSAECGVLPPTHFITGLGRFEQIAALLEVIKGYEVPPRRWSSGAGGASAVRSVKIRERGASWYCETNIVDNNEDRNQGRALDHWPQAADHLCRGGGIRSLITIARYLSSSHCYHRKSFRSWFSSSMSDRRCTKQRSPFLL